VTRGRARLGSPCPPGVERTAEMQRTSNADGGVWPEMTGDRGHRSAEHDRRKRVNIARARHGSRRVGANNPSHASVANSPARSRAAPPLRALRKLGVGALSGRREATGKLRLCHEPRIQDSRCLNPGPEASRRRLQEGRDAHGGRCHRGYLQETKGNRRAGVRADRAQPGDRQIPTTRASHRPARVAAAMTHTVSSSPTATKSPPQSPEKGGIVTSIGTIQSSFPIREPDRLERPPHELGELLVLCLLRRIQADVQATAFRQSPEQLVARGEPQLVPQCISQTASDASVHRLTVSSGCAANIATDSVCG